MPDIALSAYAAGLMDGEGTICTVTSKLGTSRAVTLDYRPRVVVAMTTRQPLDLLAQHWGGNILLRAPQRPGHRPVFVWYLRIPEIRSFLEDVRPFMRLKQVQAWLMLEYLEQRSVTRTTPGFWGRRPLAAEEVALREGFHLALQSANGGN